MVSQNIAFQINTEKLDLLVRHQKRLHRTSISTDLFAKELLFERLNELEKKGE